MAHRAQAEWVRADVAGGQQSGVRSTATFFVNGVRLRSPSDLDAVRAAIEDALLPEQGGSG
jgi:protein-disulfide isomerase